MAEFNTSVFIRDLEELRIHLSEQQVRQFMDYYELLILGNQVMNLTAITEFDEVMKKHFIDSVSLVKAVNPGEIESVIDVGTGAGFPGLALKIAFPDLKVVLLDSLNKRVHFLNDVIEKLELSHVEAVHARAEDAARNKLYRQRFDLCVSRAVSNLSTLSEYCIPFVKTGGLFIPYKSEKAFEEVQSAQKAFRLLGGKVEKQVEFTLPDSDIYRNLIVIRKTKETSSKFPRKAGMPSKEPL